MKLHRFLCHALVLGLGGCVSAPPSPPLAAATAASLRHPARVHDETPAAWFVAGAEAARQRGAGAASARNLILFVGDGMGPTTVAAARIFEGQLRGGMGEEHLLSFERFPFVAFSKTYNTDLQTPDSAGTMTAMMSGVKTRAGLIGVDSRARLGDCASESGARIPSLLMLAEQAGLATGIVTTTRITHATPAATYAHSAHRDWEADALMPAEARQRCRDIALQLLEFAHGDGIELVLGGGRQMFLPEHSADPEYPDQRGLRQDGRDLLAEWQARHPEGRFVWSLEQFLDLDLAASGPVLGLFQPGHMQFEHERPGDAAGEPSLAQMVSMAIARLQRSEQGFLLVVEAGRIDHAHHGGNAYRALTDTVALAQAVEAALAATSQEDTLIMVTADHSHVLSFAGYSARGNPILGKVSEGRSGNGVGMKRDLAGRSFTTLSYANGPGYGGASDVQPQGAKRFPHEPKRFEPSLGGRPDLAGVDTTAPDFMQPALLPLESETHGGEDVGVYAIGPGAEAVRGVIEQNVIFHILRAAHPRLRGAPGAGPADMQER
jgi:alkaline phosphatase